MFIIIVSSVYEHSNEIRGQLDLKVSTYIFDEMTDMRLFALEAIKPGKPFATTLTLNYKGTPNPPGSGCSPKAECLMLPCGFVKPKFKSLCASLGPDIVSVQGNFAET